MIYTITIYSYYWSWFSLFKLTDFRGEPYAYDKGATWPNEYGVLATALEEDHDTYLKTFPQDIKDQIKDYYKKKWLNLINEIDCDKLLKMAFHWHVQDNTCYVHKRNFHTNQSATVHYALFSVFG